MTSSLLVAWFVQEPFQPFMLYLADGRQMEVRHPEFATLAKSALGVWALHPTGEFEIVDAALIVSIRSIGPGNRDQFIR